MKVIEELQKAGVVDREIVQKAVTAATDQIVRAAESRYDKVKRQATALLGQMQKLIDGVPDFSTSSSPTPARMDPPSPPTPARRSPSPPRRVVTVREPKEAPASRGWPTRSCGRSCNTRPG
jgi:hypothetical protein